MLEACSAQVVPRLENTYHLVRPKATSASNLVATSPHSGRQYPSYFIKQSALNLDALRQVEDAAMDKLLTYEPLPCPLLMAEFPRSFVDLNRNPHEIDSTMFDEPFDAPVPPIQKPKTTPYLQWGLGMIPSKGAKQQNIYHGTIPASEVSFRRKNYYTPFHERLTELLSSAKKRGNSEVLLIDCHSMPSSTRARADVIVGDGDGLTSTAWLRDEAEAYFKDEGLKVALNSPFSGGYITRHYGKPASGISALQIEICRSLYLDEEQIALKPNWQETAMLLCGFITYMDSLLN